MDTRALGLKRRDVRLLVTGATGSGSLLGALQWTKDEEVGSGGTESVGTRDPAAVQN